MKLFGVIEIINSSFVGVVDIINNSFVDQMDQSCCGSTWGRTVSTCTQVPTRGSTGIDAGVSDEVWGYEG